MYRSTTLKYINSLLALATLCISPAIAETYASSYAYNSAGSYAYNVGSVSASSQSPGGYSRNMAMSDAASGASGEAGSATGAPFMAITVPKYIPEIPSGIPPAFAPPSNYAVSSLNSSNSVSSEQQIQERAQAAAGTPKVKIWNARHK